MLTTDLTVDADPDVVTFRFSVTNDGNHPARLEFRSAKHADVAVKADDETVWRWSDGRAFVQAIQPVSLEPGQTETYEFAWQDPEAGDYEVVATLDTTETYEFAWQEPEAGEYEAVATLDTTDPVDATTSFSV